MNIDIYSDRAKQAVQAAQGAALARRNQQFAPEHLLKACSTRRTASPRT
jgi:ATP-dependent Clp protease ATP-binding subunit ClpB